MTFAANTNTVIRAGYGLFWAPWNYNTSAHGQIGFSRTTSLNQSSPEGEVPLTVLDNPFPSGLLQPIGSSQGLLTGVGGNISYVDQTSTAPRVQQFSVDFQRELPGAQAVTVSYVGSRGDNLSLGGSNDAGE